MARAVKIAILGDSRSLQRALSQSESRLGRVAGKANDLGKNLAKGFAVAATAVAVGGAAIIKSSVDVASNIEQASGAVETIWGNQSKAVEKWAADNQKAYKSTKQDALDMATTLGQAGVKSLPQLQKVMGAGSDLVAAFGGNMTDFTANVSSAMRGEFDGLQKWVPTINAAAVEAEMASTKVSKSQAILNIINREGGKVVGQAARESNTFAGMQQKLGILLERVQEKIGSKVIPVLVKLGDWFINKGVPFVEKWVPVLRDKLQPAIDKVQEVVAKLQPYLDKVGQFFKENPEVIRNVAIALGVAAAALVLVNAGMAIFAALTSPIGLVVLAIVAVVAGITLLYKKNQTFRDFVDKKVMPVLRAMGKTFRDDIWPAIKKVADFIADHVFPVVKKLVETHFKTTIKVAGAVIDAFVSLAKKSKEKFDDVVGFGKKMRDGITSVKDGVKDRIDSIKGTFTSLRDRFSSVVGSYSAKGGGILGKAHDLVSKLKSVPGSLLDSFKDITKKPLKAVIDVAINPFIKTINKLPGVDIDPVKGYSDGGWTGPGGKYQPAGVVHADEFVINKASRRAIESKAPGFLDRLNGYAKGGRVWPLKGGVTSTYPGHSGVDLNAPNDFGAPVHAVTDGTAYPYSSSWAGGNSVRLIGGGTSQIYAHMMRRGKLGRVSAGDVIGYVGSEGNSTGPHLHFQIDPMGYGPALGFLQGASQPKGGGFLSSILGKFSDIKSFVTDKIGGVLGKVSGGGLFSSSNLKGLVKAVLKDVTSTIPGMATGGIVRASRGGTIIRAGEGGVDEAIVPLRKRGLGTTVNIDKIEIRAEDLENIKTIEEFLGMLKTRSRQGVRG